MLSSIALKLNRVLGSLLVIGLICGNVWAQDNTPEVTTLVLRASLSKTETANLTLRDALAIAQAENPVHQAAIAGTKEAKALYLTRIAQFLPDIRLSESVAFYEGNILTSSGGFLKMDRESHQPQIAFRFGLLPKGAQYLQARIAKKELEAQRKTEQAVLQQILRQTANLYYELQRRLADMSIAELLLEETKANLTLNKERLQGGSGRRLDVLQAETQLIDAQRQYTEAARAAESAALRLNEILNLSAFAGVIPTHSEQQIHTLIESDDDFKAKLSQAIQVNPRIVALEKRLESLTQLFKPTSLAIAVLPEIYVQYRTGRVGTTPELNDMARFDERSYGIGMTIENMGISQIMRYKGIRAQIIRLEHQLEAEKNAIERELSEAWISAKAQQSQIKIALRKLVVSGEMLQDSIEQLKTGQGHNIDVLNAQANLNLARQDLNSTILEYNQAQVDLIYGLGLASINSLTGGMP